MKKYCLKIVVNLLTILLSTSCATLINTRIVRVNVYSETDSVKVHFNNDSLNWYNLPTSTDVIRSKNSLMITAQKDTTQKKIEVKRKISTAFWLGNLAFGPVGIVGYIVDLTNHKKFTYPQTIFIDYYNNRYYTVQKSLYKNQIKFTPTKTINIFNPGFELSYEREYGRKFSTQVSVAYLVDCFHTTPYEDYKGYRVMLEEKLFFFKRKNFRQYFSLETGYYAASMKSSAYFVPKGIEWSDELYYDSQYKDIFNLKRKGVIIDVKYGMQFLIKRFTIDYTIGLGVIIHNIKHTNRLNPDDKMVSPRHPNVYYMMEYEGKHSMPNFPMTLKLGYSF